MKLSARAEHALSRITDPRERADARRWMEDNSRGVEGDAEAALRHMTPKQRAIALDPLGHGRNAL